MVAGGCKGRDWLASTSYPGRGLVVGCTAAGTARVQIYWTMGRSRESRNRRLVREPDGTVRVAVADAGAGIAGGDERLLLYRAMRAVRRNDGSVTHVVSNGDQTDTIAAAMVAGDTFAAAFARRDAEPDPPHYTARIAGAVTIGDVPGSGGYELAIVKSGGGEPRQVTCQHFRYRSPRPGWGHCITTYEGDGSPLPPFAGEPFLLPLAATPAGAVRELWELLNRHNRVSAAAKFIDRTSSEARVEIINRNPDGAAEGGG